MVLEKRPMSETESGLSQRKEQVSGQRSTGVKGASWPGHRVGIGLTSKSRAGLKQDSWVFGERSAGGLSTVFGLSTSPPEQQA